MIGPLLFTQSYAYAIAGRGRDFAGAPFFLAALLLALAALTAWRVVGRDAGTGID